MEIRFGWKFLFGAAVLLSGCYGGWYWWVGDHDWRDREVLKYERSVQFLSQDFTTLGNAFGYWGSEMGGTGIDWALFSDNTLKISGIFAREDESVPSPENGVPEIRYFWNHYRCDFFYKEDRRIPSRFKIAISPPHDEKFPQLGLELAAAIEAHLVDSVAAFEWQGLSVTVTQDVSGAQRVTLAGDWPPKYVEVATYKYDRQALDRYAQEAIPVASELSKLGFETGRFVWPHITPQSHGSYRSLIVSSRDETSFVAIGKIDYPLLDRPLQDNKSRTKGDWLSVREESSDGFATGEYVKNVSNRGRVYYEKDGLWTLEFDRATLSKDGGNFNFRLEPVGLFDQFKYAPGESGESK